MTYIQHYQSPLGPMTLASDGHSLIGLWFHDQKYYGSTLIEPIINEPLEVFDITCQWLDLYFAGEQPSFTPPLKFNDSPFRQLVWDILLQIPYGTTLTYKEIGQQIAKLTNKPTFSAQAVGGAVGHNPLSILVPCHRVLGTNGSFTGYAGGIDKKIYLLECEKVDCSNFTQPK